MVSDDVLRIRLKVGQRERLDSPISHDRKTSFPRGMIPTGKGAYSDGSYQLFILRCLLRPSPATLTADDARILGKQP